MRLISIAAALLALAACHKPAPQPAHETAPAAEAGPQKGVDRSHKGEGILEAKILDPSGKQTDVATAAGAGKPVLLNLWATWCAPCVKELPTLQALHNQ